MNDTTYTVGFTGHFDPADRAVLAAVPRYDYERQEWATGYDHAHYADPECAGAPVFCHVLAVKCETYRSEWSIDDASRDLVALITFDGQ